MAVENGGGGVGPPFLHRLYQFRSRVDALVGLGDDRPRPVPSRAAQARAQLVAHLQPPRLGRVHALQHLIGQPLPVCRSRCSPGVTEWVGPNFQGFPRGAERFGFIRIASPAPNLPGFESLRGSGIRAFLLSGGWGSARGEFWLIAPTRTSWCRDPSAGCPGEPSPNAIHPALRRAMPPAGSSGVLQMKANLISRPLQNRLRPFLRMSRFALSFATSLRSRSISSCSGFMCP